MSKKEKKDSKLIEMVDHSTLIKKENSEMRFKRSKKRRKVKVQVLIGSLMIEDPPGSRRRKHSKVYSKGDIFECSPSRAKRMSRSSVRILDEEED